MNRISFSSALRSICSTSISSDEFGFVFFASKAFDEFRKIPRLQEFLPFRWKISATPVLRCYKQEIMQMGGERSSSLSVVSVKYLGFGDFLPCDFQEFVDLLLLAVSVSYAGVNQLL